MFYNSWLFRLLKFQDRNKFQMIFKIEMQQKQSFENWEPSLGNRKVMSVLPSVRSSTDVSMNKWESFSPQIPSIQSM